MEYRTSNFSSCPNKLLLVKCGMTRDPKHNKTPFRACWMLSMMSFKSGKELLQIKHSNAMDWSQVGKHTGIQKNSVIQTVTGHVISVTQTGTGKIIVAYTALLSFPNHLCRRSREFNPAPEMNTYFKVNFMHNINCIIHWIKSLASYCSDQE